MGTAPRLKKGGFHIALLHAKVKADPGFVLGAAGGALYDAQAGGYGAGIGEGFEVAASERTQRAVGRSHGRAGRVRTGCSRIGHGNRSSGECLNRISALSAARSVAEAGGQHVGAAAGLAGASGR